MLLDTACTHQACLGCLAMLTAGWRLFRHDHAACAGSLWYASAVALASVTKMYRANEDGRALPVLLLAPVAASGEPVVPLCPVMQHKPCVLCTLPASSDLIWECWEPHTCSRLDPSSAATSTFQPAPMACTTNSMRVTKVVV